MTRPVEIVCGREFAVKTFCLATKRLLSETGPERPDSIRQSLDAPAEVESTPVCVVDTLDSVLETR